MPNFSQTDAPYIFKIQWLSFSVLILGKKICFLGPSIFKIPQWNWHYYCIPPVVVCMRVCYLDDSTKGLDNVQVAFSCSIWELWRHHLDSFSGNGINLPLLRLKMMKSFSLLPSFWKKLFDVNFTVWTLSTWMSWTD